MYRRGSVLVLRWSRRLPGCTAIGRAKARPGGGAAPGREISGALYDRSAQPEPHTAPLPPARTVGGSACAVSTTTDQRKSAIYSATRRHRARRSRGGLGSHGQPLLDRSGDEHTHLKTGALLDIIVNEVLLMEFAIHEVGGDCWHVICADPLMVILHVVLEGLGVLEF